MSLHQGNRPRDRWGGSRIKVPGSIYGFDLVDEHGTEGCYSYLLHNHGVQDDDKSLVHGDPAPSTSDVQLVRALARERGASRELRLLYISRAGSRPFRFFARGSRRVTEQLAVRFGRCAANRDAGEGMIGRRCHIRLARSEDLEALPEIERLAGVMFKTYPGDLGIPEEVYEQPNTVETFAQAQTAGRLWVAITPDELTVGFALVREIDRYAHIDELDVLPSYGRQGIGSSLLSTVCAWAKDAGYPAVTLRTFRDVPWNGPFYERRGFRVVESTALSKEYVSIESSEVERGMRTDNRVTMVYETSG